MADEATVSPDWPNSPHSIEPRPIEFTDLGAQRRQIGARIGWPARC